MKENLTRLTIALAIIAVLFGLSSIPLLAPAQAAPPAAPTPVANILTTDSASFFRFQPATAMTADTNTSGIEVLAFDSLDVQHVIDHGTVNTTTLTIQYSNDNSNWVDGLALVSSSAADGTDITRVPVFGRYMRVKQDVTNTNTITITLNAVGR